MTDFQDQIAGGTEPLPPSPPPLPPAAAPTGNDRFTPKRLIITFVVVLIAVVGGTLTAQALSNRGSATDQAMGNWMSSYGANYLDVSHDVGTVSQATDAASLRPACVKLQGDVRKAQSDPAMPLGSVESQWSVVLANLSTAANDCVAGVDQQNSTLLNTAQDHLSRAAKAYIDIVKAVEQSGN